MRTLDQLEMIIEVLFCHYPVQKVLRRCFECPGIQEDDFVNIASTYVKTQSKYLFSSDDLRNQYRFFQQQVDLELHLTNHTACAAQSLKPMNCLFYYAKKMLYTADNEVVCRYERLLNWWNLTRKIGVDLPVAAYLAMEKSPEELNPTDLDWKMVLSHDNFQLRRIMERGLAENHFHLYGSAPVFHLSWISLMNRLDNSNVAARLRQYDKKRKDPETKVDATLNDLPLRLQYLQAATMRLILFSVVTVDSHPAYSLSILDGLVRPERFDERKESILRRLEKEFVQDQWKQDIFSRLRESVDRITWPVSIDEWRREKSRDLWEMMRQDEQSENSDDTVRDVCRRLLELIENIARPITVDERIRFICFHLYFQIYQEMRKVQDDESKLRICDKLIKPLEQELLPVHDDEWKEDVYHRLGKLVMLLCTPYANAEESLLELDDRLHGLQYAIDALRDWNGNSTLPDYTLLACPKDLRQDDDYFFQGERWLLYQCLYRIHRNLLAPEYINLFYAYLILKRNIRRELIQGVHGVGFSNFQDYERRKFDLIDESLFRDYERRKFDPMKDGILRGKAGAAARAAVRKTLLQAPYIRSMEIRISPYENTRDNVDTLRNLDRILSDPEDAHDPGQKNRFFYVFHFLKSEDDWRKKDRSAFYCRHYLYRRKLERQTRSIQNLRERYATKEAKRVLGIDAASREICCRPEVFGTCFRFLHKHSFTAEKSDGFEHVPQLRRTFHVGEDFMDITDGLRAIDEAIQFLNLESGDRLGHALVLGIDVQGWYAAKNNVITLPLQDHLDNMAWLYHRLLKANLPGTSDVLAYLKSEFKCWFGRVYKRHMSADTISFILRKYLGDSKIPPEYRWNHFDQYAAEPMYASTDRNASPISTPNQYDFDIGQYYRAWKLRGDDPALYNDGYFKPPKSTDLYDECRVNEIFPSDSRSRYDPGVFLIHYYYHYSAEVRDEGERQREVKVPQIYIDAVAKVQRAMQQEIGRLGLGIECNPTSNVLIGTFKRYEQHPILRFYNRELEVDPNELAINPQLLVSINTDDQGIFSTSLENEYALMARALEEVVNPDGSPRYPRQRIYAWLDAIRQMGLEQAFCKGKWRYFDLPGRRFRIVIHRKK